MRDNTDRYLALLRAVNIGGSGKISMAHLRAVCSDLGFGRVETYIASGNLIFESSESPAVVKAKLESRLVGSDGRPVRVVIRTGAELSAVLEANPFPAAAAKHTVAIFLDRAPAADALAQVVGKQDEELQLGVREIYVHYNAGIGRSRLKIPAAQSGTARNMNTIAKLVELAAGTR